jgi:hypothetical protein
MESILSINSRNCFITEFYPRPLFNNNAPSQQQQHYQSQQQQQQQKKRKSSFIDNYSSLSMIAKEKVNINRRSSQSVAPMETIMEEEENSSLFF